MLIVWGEPQFPDYVSNQARDFIQQALQKNPDRRPTMVDLVQHPWIANYKCRLQDGGRPENSRTKFLTSRCSFKVAPKAAMQMEGSGGSTVSQAINGDPNLQSPGKSLPPKPVLRRAATSRALECAKPPKAISRSLYPALTQSQPVSSPGRLEFPAIHCL